MIFHQLFELTVEDHELRLIYRSGRLLKGTLDIYKWVFSAYTQHKTRAGARVIVLNGENNA